MSTKISVVIPVYNGEQYLIETLESLLAQTFTDFEVICVNDCSTDRSPAILREYQEKDARIRVLSTESNLGIVPKVLNFVFPYVRGALFAYASQDDFFSNDWLECMYSKWLSTKADSVIPDVVFFRHNAKSGKLVGLRGNREAVLSNREAVQLSLDWTIPGFALWNTDLVRRIGYREFGLTADEYSTREFFFHCNRIVFSSGTFYYRQDNPQAITKKLSYKSFDVPYTHLMLYEFLVKHGFDKEVCSKQLMRAVSSIIWLRQLLAINKSSFASSEKREAESRIQKCYSRLNEAEIRKVITSQKGAENTLKAIMVTNGYLFFNVACVSGATLRILADALAKSRASTAIS